MGREIENRRERRNPVRQAQAKIPTLENAIKAMLREDKKGDFEQESIPLAGVLCALA